ARHSGHSGEVKENRQDGILARYRDTISVLSFASTDSMALVGAYATSLDERNVGCLFPYSLAMLSLWRPPGSPGPLFPTAPALCTCVIISGPFTTLLRSRPSIRR